MKREFGILVTYSDGSDFNFVVTIEGNDCDVMAELMMITRGVLQVSIAKKAECFNTDGVLVCSYTK